MEQLTLQTILGSIVVLGCAIYSIKAFFQIFWAGVKLGGAVMIGVMVTDLTIPAAKPYLNAATSASIESALKDFRTYAYLVGEITMREIGTISTTRS
jgi:hypothetical protein